MSHSYLVTLFDPITPEIRPDKYEIDIDYFTQAILNRWEDMIQIYDSPKFKTELHMRHEHNENNSLSLRVHSDNILVIGPGTVSEVAEFINWYREYIPEDLTIYVIFEPRSIDDRIQLDKGDEITPDQLKELRHY